MDISKQRIAVYGLILNQIKKEEFLIIKEQLMTPTQIFGSFREEL